MRRCSYCGEPIADHGLQEPTPGQAAAIERLLPGRHPAQIRAALVGGALGRTTRGRLAGRGARDPSPMRVCPVVQVQRTRPDGTEYMAMVPRRLAPLDPPDQAA